MSILVVCPGCKASFHVSDKFAGKEGPCPKCKAKIKIPEQDEVVKIHVPEEFASGGKSSTGRPTTKPISREETKLTPVMMVAIGGGILAAIAAALAMRLSGGPNPLLASIGLLLLSPPLVIGCYAILRDAELDPHRGTTLLVRSGICALVYAAAWGVFVFLLPAGLTDQLWSWLFIAPPFLLIGGLTALACLDLDFGTGVIHYSFYVLVTMAVGYLAGLPPVWAAS